eukprot:jgi/Mesvir1/20943/Mv08014-RA.1
MVSSRFTVCGAAIVATVAWKWLRRTRRDFAGLDGMVSFSSRMIAAARALESESEEAIIYDPLAEELAGPTAMKQARQRVTERSRAGEKRRAGIAIRTRYLDDALVEAVTVQLTPSCATVTTTTVHEDDVTAATGGGDSGSQGHVGASEQAAGKEASPPPLPSQVVILGAGMDSRVYRLPRPPNCLPRERTAANKVSGGAGAVAGASGYAAANGGAVGGDTFKELGGATDDGATKTGLPDARVSFSVVKNAEVAFHPIADLFEVDQADVLRAKEATYERLREKGVMPPLSLAQRRTVIAANVEEVDTLEARLVGGGVRFAEPVVWLLEGLLVYLEPDNVARLARKMAELSAPGSVLLASLVNETCVTRAVANASKGSLMEHWKWGVNEPFKYFSQLGWHVLSVVQYGAPEANYGRYEKKEILPLEDNSVGRAMLLRAVKL